MAHGDRVRSTRLQLLLLVLILFSSSANGRTSIISSQERLEFQRELKRLNKPALKSIQSPDGDIIDCVHISQQPAFDHPKLKNHTIQLKPSSHPQGTPDTTGEPRIQLWHQTGQRCPESTIPIRRTKMADLFRASSLKTFGKKKHGTIPQPIPVKADPRSSHEYAVAYAQTRKYYGTRVSINMWKPKVQEPDEFSLSQLWLVGGSGKTTNTVETGFQVYKNLYGDNNTRLFVYWTSDDYQTTGCYNLACSGFIQTNNNIVLGGTVLPVSTYGGSQYDMTILVWKAANDGNWWMKYGNQNVGYWPSNLYSSLADSASLVEWGGEIVNTKPKGKHTSTVMGSGHFPTEGFGKASYFRNIQIVDGSNTLRSPSNIGTIKQLNCYDIQIANSTSSSWGIYLYYGGPGRNPKCP